MPGAESVKGRECGNGVTLRHENGWATQYCHMAKGSIRVSRGQKVETGTPLGRVGLSGNTEFPHLHFSVLHYETKIDPFAYGAKPGTCGDGGQSLWNEVGARVARLPPRRGSQFGIFRQCRHDGADRVGRGQAPAAQGDFACAGRLCPRHRARSGRRAGAFDRLAGRQAVCAAAPAAARPFQGAVLHDGRQEARAAPWPAGTYTAKYNVLRDGKSVLEKSFTFDLPPG